MTTFIPTDLKRIGFDRITKDFAAYYDDELIGYYATYLAAETALNDYVYELLTRESRTVHVAEVEQAYSTIAVYLGDTEIWHDQFPGAWPCAALQKLARRWMRASGGTRYAIRQTDGTIYRSKPHKEPR